MKIEVFKNRIVYKEGVAGTQKENNFEIIDFKFPEELSNYKKYIEFDTQDGKFVDEIKNNSYSIERNITKYPKVVVQVVMKDLQNDIVFKSQLFNLFFNDSINASEELERENRGLLDTFELELLEVQTNISTNSQEIDSLKTKVQNIESEQITQNENIEDNTNARHTHSNKSVLDDIKSTDITNWNNKSNFSGSYNDLTNKPNIPSEITETIISNWGFTKNSGSYSKPQNGIPKTDLESSIQTSLEKADTALQSYTEQYTGTIVGITMNGSSKGTSGVVDLGTVITEHQDITGKENTANKVTLINSSSTDKQYPSAKCVYNFVNSNNTAIESLESENEALYNDHPDITEMGTDVILNGTGNLKMKVDVGGNSTQIQYEGYNLFEPPTDPGVVGIELTKNADGSIIINGTAVNSFNITVTGKTLIAGTYTLQCKYSGNLPPNQNTRIQLYSASTTTTLNILNTDPDNKVRSTTLSETLNDIQMRIRIEGGFTYNNVKLYPLLVKGDYSPSTIPEFEKYVGGKSIPNSTDKQDINNVQGNIVVTSRNSNNSKSNTTIFTLVQGQKLMLGDTLEDDGIHHKRAQTTFTGTNATLLNAKTNGAYLCNQKRGGNLTGKTLTFDNEVTNAVIEYELETETTEAYTSAQQTAYNKLKEMQSYYDLTYVVGTSDNAQPIITAHAKKSLKVMQNEIDSIESRLSVLE